MTNILNSGFILEFEDKLQVRGLTMLEAAQLLGWHPEHLQAIYDEPAGATPEEVCQMHDL